MSGETKEFLAAVAVISNLEVSAEQRISRAKEWAEQYEARKRENKVAEELRAAARPLTHKIRFFGRS